MVGRRPQHAASKLACLELSTARSCNHDIIIIDCLKYEFICSNITCKIHGMRIRYSEGYARVCYVCLKTARNCNFMVLDVTVFFLITAFLKKKLPFLAKGLHIMENNITNLMT